MESKTRAEKIAKWFFQVDDPRQVECENLIAAQIEEAEREAVNRTLTAPEADSLWHKAKELGYAEGFRAAREKIANMFKPDPYPDCPVQMTYSEAYERIREVEQESK